MITKTRLQVNQAGHASVAPGSSLQFTVRTEPAVTGPVTVNIQQFDPLGGWQFVRAVRGRAVNGTATVSFVAPTVGRWRASATYDGTQSTAPSATPGFAPVLVAAPLSD